MENTISRLFEIEEKAKLILDRANEEKIKLHDSFEADLAKMEKTISNNNTKKINEYRLQIEKELTSEKKLLLQKSEKQLKELNEFYQLKHNELVDQVYNSIIRS